MLARLPKAELHVHLDGCLRSETMIELASEAGIELPSRTRDGLAQAMVARGAHNLEEYLQRYRYTVSLMQRRAAIERIAYEFVVDVARENVRVVEVRFCPALHTPAIKASEAVEAALDGFSRGAAETGCRVGLIVCALRTLSPDVSEEMARLAVAYRTAGVVAFDLAGAEFGHAAKDHASAFAIAHDYGLPCTCHAGEADGPDSLRQALYLCGADRIGHGTRLREDPELEEYVCRQRIPLEICLTSNVHTRAVSKLADHPLRHYFDRGCVVTLNTDGRLIDGVTLSDEYWAAHVELGFTRDEIDRLILNAFESLFMPEDEKARLVSEIRTELTALR